MNDEVVRRTTGMRARTLDELTADYEELGVKFRRQVSKKVLRKAGAWASVAFVFQTFDAEMDEYGEPQLMLATFKNSGGMYTRYSYFIVKNKKEAETIWNMAKEI